jgi:transcriptional regulator with XRE-family HTH domain
MKTTQTPWNKKLGRNIARYRKAARMSEALLAGYCEARASEIRAYESGARSPHPSRLRPMATALGVSVDDLLP